MLPKANRECNNPKCNKQYYCNISEQSMFSWKNSTCSLKCYEELIEYIENKETVQDKQVEIKENKIQKKQSKKNTEETTEIK